MRKYKSTENETKEKKERRYKLLVPQMTEDLSLLILHMLKGQ